MTEREMRDLLAKCCREQGFNYAVKAMETPNDVTQWTSVALAFGRALLERK